MENEEFYSDDFFIYLTIDEIGIEDTQVKVSNPDNSIQDQINSIVKVFDLPKMDNGGNPITYRLGRATDDEVEILETITDEGDYTVFADYNVQSEDHLILVKEVIAG